ncbi:MAG: hypothetical protein WCV86_00835 [Patescibacteria group bacterium]
MARKVSHRKVPKAQKAREVPKTKVFNPQAFLKRHGVPAQARAPFIPLVVAVHDGVSDSRMRRVLNTGRRKAEPFADVLEKHKLSFDGIVSDIIANGRLIRSQLVV